MLSNSIRAACIVVALSLTGQAAVANTTPVFPVGTPEAENFNDLLTKMAKALRAVDYEAACPDLQTILARPEFGTLPSDLRFMLYRAMAACDMELNNGQMALSYFQKALEIDPLYEERSFWAPYFMAALQTGNMPETYKALVILDRIDPQFVFGLDHKFWGAYLDDLKDDEALKYRVLEILWARNYVYEPDYKSEFIWWSLFTLDVKHNNTERAAQLALRLSHPGHVIQLLIDSRYSVYGVTVPDYARAHSENMDRLRQEAQKQPGKLNPKVILGYSLLEAGRPDEVVAIFEPLIVAMKADPTQFTDYEDSAHWVYDTYARALIDMGRHDEALKAVTAGYELSRENHDPVSLEINLANYYTSLGHPKDALRILTSFESSQASDYGRVSAYGVKACAYSELGDTAGLEEMMTLLKPIAHKGIIPYVFTLACIGDETALATYIIERLNDPDTRGQMLLTVQSYRSPPHPLALDIKKQAILKAAIARSDVQATVAQYGRIYEFPTHRPGY